MPAKVLRRRENIEEIAPRVTEYFFKNIRPGARVKMIFPDKKFIAEKRPLPEDADISLVEARVFPSENGYYLVDNRIVMMPVFDPAHESSIFGMIKIYDPAYAAKVKKRFEETWRKATQVDLGKELCRGTTD
jgi:hypothetical protein